MSRPHRSAFAQAAGLEPRPVVAEAAQRILDLLPRDGLPLAELVERSGLRHDLALRGVFALLGDGRAAYRGGRLARAPEPEP